MPAAMRRDIADLVPGGLTSAFAERCGLDPLRRSNLPDSVGSRFGRIRDFEIPKVHMRVEHER